MSRNRSRGVCLRQFKIRQAVLVACRQQDFVTPIVRGARCARAWFRSYFATARRSRQHQHQSCGETDSGHFTIPKRPRGGPARGLKILKLCPRAREYPKSDESLSIRRDSVDDNRGPDNGTASGPRTRARAFLRELGRWVP
jgi:hypothetical protein